MAGKNGSLPARQIGDTGKPLYPLGTFVNSDYVVASALRYLFPSDTPHKSWVYCYPQPVALARQRRLSRCPGMRVQRRSE